MTKRLFKVDDTKNVGGHLEIFSQEQMRVPLCVHACICDVTCGQCCSISVLVNCQLLVIDQSTAAGDNDHINF